MKIIDVIPISRGISVEKLTYFTSEDAPLGSLVTVPLKKRMVSGIVIASQNAEDSKSFIKRAEFQIKKVSKLEARQFFLKEFIAACGACANYFASSTGSVLHALASHSTEEEIQKIENTHADSRTERLYERYAIQAEDEERFAHYKSLIREQFAKKASVFFCLPSIHEVETAVMKLEKGIEEYTYVLHGGVKQKDLVALYKKILSENHPVLIICTGGFLSLPRKDIGAIIVERENSKGYKTLSRPYLDIRTFADFFAKNIQAKLIVGDFFLQIETIHRFKIGEYQELYPLKFRSLTTAEEQIVDMRKYKLTEKSFTVISDELKELIEQNKANSENLFIFTARKGLSPTTVCSDCGTIVTCTKCQSPVVLHSSSRGNFFLCHHCGERTAARSEASIQRSARIMDLPENSEDSGNETQNNETETQTHTSTENLTHDVPELCKSCGGWRLTTLGIGTERVEEEIRRMYPQVRVFVFDKEKIKTLKRALTMIAEFYAAPGSILIGTEMALMYLDKPLANTAVASIDSLFSVPDFKISEKILDILLKIRSLTETKLVLQTRNPDQNVFQYAIGGNTMEFYREEIELRKAFSYPPFSVLIKVSLEGRREVIAEEMALAKEQLEDYSVDVFPSFIKGRAGRSFLHALIKIPANEWPNSKLLAKLSSLPPNFTIKVDPDSLL